MRMIVGLAGLTLIGIGIGTIIISLKVGLCAGGIVLGLGLVVDALRK